MEANAKKTTLPRLIELFRAGTPKVKAAVTNTLLERGDKADLQKALTPEDGPDSDLRKTLTLLQNQPEAQKQEAERLFAVLSEKKYDSSYTEKLLQFAQLKDRRVLPLIEDYVRVVKRAPSGIFSFDHKTAQKGYEAEKLYWLIKWQGLSVQQQMDDFVRWAKSCDDIRNGAPTDFIFPDGIEQAIAQEGDKIVPLLRDVALRHTNELCLFEYCVYALAEVATPQAVEVLRTISLCGNKEKERMARTFLVNLKDPQSVQQELPRVIQGLTNKEQPAGTTATLLWSAQRLAQAGADKQKLEEAVLPYVQQGNLAAVVVLRDFGSQKSVDFLLKLLEQPYDKNNYNQSLLKPAIITTLGRVSRTAPEKVLPALLSASISEDVALRVVGAQALGHLGSPLAIPILEELAKKETIQRALLFQVSSIYLIGGKEAYESLERLRLHAQEIGNSFLADICAEGRLRLEQEKRRD